MFTRRLHLRHRRKGLSVVFSVLCLVVLLAIAALAVDIGYLHNAHAELQRSADAAALAACWEMGEQYVYGSGDVTPAVRSVAIATAGSNDVTAKSPSLGDERHRYRLFGEYSQPKFAAPHGRPDRLQCRDGTGAT